MPAPTLPVRSRWRQQAALHWRMTRPGFVLITLSASLLGLATALSGGAALDGPAALATLLLAGVALRLSWRPAGLVVQFFFLGNLLPMMVVVGQLYIDSPLRLCNAYLLDDQARLGAWLIGGAAVLGAAWLAWTGWVLAGRQTPPAPAGALHGMTGQNPPR